VPDVPIAAKCRDEPLEDGTPLTMDRHNQLHRSARVDLPASLRQPDATTGFEFRFRPVSPKFDVALGLVSFLGCGVVVIATASLLALYIH
jgi:hypothetical protein